MSLITCKICRHSVQTIHDAEFEIDYFHCSYCQFIFIDEAKIIPNQQEKARYATHNNSLENTGYVDMFNRFIKEGILPFQDGIQTALDFGCGPGPVLAHLLTRIGIETDIYDIYFEAQPVYIGKSYDLITCTEVLEHIREPMQVLELLAGLLKPGGILAMMTNFHPGIPAFKSWWYRRDETHISFFNLDTFDYISEKLGLTRLMENGKNTISFKK